MPKKILREKLAKLIESDFSKATLNSTIKLFETHIDNECVEAVIEILKFVKSEKEIPNIYKILLKEIRKDSPGSSWLTSYTQSDTRLFVSFLSGECDIFSDIEKVKKDSHACLSLCYQNGLRHAHISLIKISPTISRNNKIVDSAK